MCCSTKYVLRVRATRSQLRQPPLQKQLSDCPFGTLVQIRPTLTEVMFVTVARTSPNSCAGGHDDGRELNKRYQNKHQVRCTTPLSFCTAFDTTPLVISQVHPKETRSVYGSHNIFLFYDLHFIIIIVFMFCCFCDDHLYFHCS